MVRIILVLFVSKCNMYYHKFCSLSWSQTKLWGANREANMQRCWWDWRRREYLGCWLWRFLKVAGRDRGNAGTVDPGWTFDCGTLTWWWCGCKLICGGCKEYDAICCRSRWTSYLYSATQLSILANASSKFCMICLISQTCWYRQWSFITWSYETWLWYQLLQECFRKHVTG
jgi:hypothetical protein